MYADVDVVVDGALEESATFHDYAVMDQYLADVADDAAGHGYPTEVFVIYHAHDDLAEDEECSCVQYLTDHHPTYSYNIAEDTK